jgi:hypothetical protein
VSSIASPKKIDACNLCLCDHVDRMPKSDQASYREMACEMETLQAENKALCDDLKQKG